MASLLLLSPSSSTAREGDQERGKSKAAHAGAGPSTTTATMPKGETFVELRDSVARWLATVVSARQLVLQHQLLRDCFIAFFAFLVAR